MTRFFAVLAFCSLAFASLTYAAPSPGDHTRTTAVRTPEARQQLRVDRYATAQMLSRELTAKLGLAAADCPAEQVAACIDHLLGLDTEAGFTEETAAIRTLDQLLHGCTGALQRTLAPVLPAEAYDRYVALLDAHDVVAR